MLKSSGSASTSATYLESDADEQLIMGIAFLQTVKLFALRFTTAEAEIEKAPKTIKVFSDALALGFDEAASQPAAQEFTLTKDQALGKELVQLRFVKFQKVTSITIFVSDNQGGEDVTRIDKLDIYGSPETTTASMSNLRGGDDE